MAKEYIEREAAEDIVLGRVEWFDWEIKASIRAIPAADVAPVKHGWWRKAVGTSGVLRMACTNCGFMRFPENDSREPMFNYCPRCGTKMDGAWNV